MTYEIKLQVGSPHMLRDHLRVAIGRCTPGGSVRHTLEDALAQIEEQVKPVVEEPLDVDQYLIDAVANARPR